MSWKPQFKLAWIGAARRSTRILLYLLQRALFMSMQQQPWENGIRRIVVYRIGNIGDILVTLPTLNAIRKRFPGAHIALLTSPGKKGRRAPRSFFLWEGGLMSCSSISARM